jgi:hypothetical protein
MQSRLTSWRGSRQTFLPIAAAFVNETTHDHCTWGGRAEWYVHKPVAVSPVCFLVVRLCYAVTCVSRSVCDFHVRRFDRVAQRRTGSSGWGKATGNDESRSGTHRGAHATALG